LFNQSTSINNCKSSPPYQNAYLSHPPEKTSKFQVHSVSSSPPSKSNLSSTSHIKQKTASLKITPTFATKILDTNLKNKSGEGLFFPSGINNISTSPFVAENDSNSDACILSSTMSTSASLDSDSDDSFKKSLNSPPVPPPSHHHDDKVFASKNESGSMKFESLSPSSLAGSYVLPDLITDDRTDENNMTVGIYSYSSLDTSSLPKKLSGSLFPLSFRGNNLPSSLPVSPDSHSCSTCFI
jgi:hypothetical protein